MNFIPITFFRLYPLLCARFNIQNSLRCNNRSRIATRSNLAFFITSEDYASSFIKLQVCKFYRPTPVCHDDQFSVYTSPYFKIQIDSCIKFMPSIARAGFYFTVRLIWDDRDCIFFFIFYSPLPFSWSAV
jgi:hypothetical protein